jgi:type II secretory pathway pseudopilin PulG
VTAGLRGRPRNLGPSDAGISLAELIVAIMVFGIVLTVVGSMFGTMTKATTYANATDQNVRNASNGMNAMSRMFRSAQNLPQLNTTDRPAFSDARAESATLVTAVNLDPSTTDESTPLEVRFTVDAKRNLRETTRTAVRPSVGSTYWVFNATSPTTARTITTPVSSTPSGAAPLFRYFSADGVELVPPTGGTLSGDDLDDIASVSITLRQANSKSTLDNGVTLVNTVMLENLRKGNG